MQKLQFQYTWDKAIAPKDREKLEMIFHAQHTHLQEGVQFSFLWEAENYKQERLITVFIHNYEDISLQLEDIVVAYYEQDKQVSIGIFTVPQAIASKTTMPWTFIFSTSNKTLLEPQYIIQNEAKVF